MARGKYTKKQPFNDGCLREARLNRVCCCEDLDFYFDESELKQIKKMWNMELSLDYMSQYLNGRDPDEIIIAITSSQNGQNQAKERRSARMTKDCDRLGERLAESKGKYQAIANSIGKLVDEKNKAYGDSFNKSGEFLKILYPSGIKPEQYGDMLGVVRMFDKLMRIATFKDAFGENPWRDCAGYAILKCENGTLEGKTND